MRGVMGMGNECKHQKIIDLMNDDNARDKIKATAQKIANGLGMATYSSMALSKTLAK